MGEKVGNYHELLFGCFILEAGWGGETAAPIGGGISNGGPDGEPWGNTFFFMEPRSRKRGGPPRRNPPEKRAKNTQPYSESANWVFPRHKPKKVWEKVLLKKKKRIPNAKKTTFEGSQRGPDGGGSGAKKALSFTEEPKKKGLKIP